MKESNLLRSSVLPLVVGAVFVSSVASAQITGPVTLESPGLGATEILSWSWGASQSGSFHVGGGGGTGKANFQDISLTRYSDRFSAFLLNAIATGDHLSSVEISRDGMTITLEHVLITSYSVGGTSSKRDPQTENITLTFEKVTFQIDWQYWSWNIATNTGG